MSDLPRFFYVKYTKNLPDLVNEYQYFKNHEVIFYFDTTALGSNYAVNEEDFRWVIGHQLEKNG